MTKKSNARKLRDAGQMSEPPAHSREIALPIPLEMYARVMAGREKAVHMNLIGTGVSRNEFLLVVLANGIAYMEADMATRERKDALVLTPAELQAQQKALRGQN